MPWPTVCRLSKDWCDLCRRAHAPETDYTSQRPYCNRCYKQLSTFVYCGGEQKPYYFCKPCLRAFLRAATHALEVDNAR